MRADGWVTAEEAFIGGPGGVIRSALDDHGCTCQPYMVSRYVERRGETPGTMTLNGEVVDIVMVSEGYDEGCLAHQEGCPMWTADPFEPLAHASSLLTPRTVAGAGGTVLPPNEEDHPGADDVHDHRRGDGHQEG